MVQVSKDTKHLNLGARESFRDKAIPAAMKEQTVECNEAKSFTTRRVIGLTLDFWSINIMFDWF